MDYADSPKFNLMCMIWMKRLQQHAPHSRIRVLTRRGLPRAVERYFAEFDNVEVIPAQRRDLGPFDHFNLSVKLYNLAALDYPFIFLDADMFVIDDLEYLWQRRDDKPWIGIDDQSSQLGLCAPFAHLNSGLQIVSDNAFYDYDAIVRCFDEHGRRFLVNGEDQSLLFEYFRAIGYDYKHPEIDEGWNCCSRFAQLHKDARGAWRGVSKGLPRSYPVHIVHYFNGASRPWHIGCPLFAEEAKALSERLANRATVPAKSASEFRGTGTKRQLRVYAMNSSGEKLAAMGEHPFTPLARTEIEWVDNPDRADRIYWRLRSDDAIRDYRQLVYRHDEFFKANEKKFLLYTDHRPPGILYLNDAPSFTPFPIYDRFTNRLSNVYAVPYLLDGVDAETAQDDAFAETCRQQAKEHDLFYHRSCAELVRSGIPGEGELTLYECAVDRAALAGMDQVGRRQQGRKLLGELARSRFYLHVGNDSSAPLLLYHALRLGTVPIVAGMPELPFADEVNWPDFALFPKPNVSLAQLLAIPAGALRRMRTNALRFGETYCSPSACNERILRLGVNA